MKRLLCVFAMLLLGASSGPLRLQVELKRDSLDVLDPGQVRITVVNPGKKGLSLKFATAKHYALKIIDSQQLTVWDSEKELAYAHVLTSLNVPAGKTKLALIMPAKPYALATETMCVLRNPCRSQR